MARCFILEPASQMSPGSESITALRCAFTLTRGQIILATSIIAENRQPLVSKGVNFRFLRSATAGSLLSTIGLFDERRSVTFAEQGHVRERETFPMNTELRQAAQSSRIVRLERGY